MKLEEDIIAMKLKSLPWVTINSPPAVKEMPFLVSSTLRVWNLLMKKKCLSTQIGPMTHLFSNPEFPLVDKAQAFLKWHRGEDVRLVKALMDGKLPPVKRSGFGV